MRILIYSPLGRSDLLRSERQNILNALQTSFQRAGDDVEVTFYFAHENHRDWPQMVVFLEPPVPSEIFTYHARAGHHIMVVEPGAICPLSHYRVTIDGFQAKWIYEGDHEQRLKELLKLRGNDEFKPTRKINKEDMSILYIGCKPVFYTMLGVRNLFNFDREYVQKLATRNSGARIFFTSHEKFNVASQFAHRISYTDLVNFYPRASAIVTFDARWIATAAIDGVHFATPAIPRQDYLGREYRSDGEGVLRNRISPEQRYHLLLQMAGQEYSLDEIESGLMWKYWSNFTFKRLERMDLPANDPQYLIEQYKLLHAQPRRYEGALDPQSVREITELVRTTGSTTLLDYGSGKGRQYDELHQHRAWGGIKPTLYDPAWEPISKKPKKQFHGVICTDVAEHIPAEHMHAFMADVINYATRFVYFAIFVGEASKNLPDGRNAHLTIQPPSWWLELIASIVDEPLETFKHIGVNTYDLVKDNLKIRVGFRVKSPD